MASPSTSSAAASPRGAAAGDATTEDPTTGLLRRVLLGLAALTMVGTVVELAMLQHWDEPVQVLPFLCVLALAVPTALLLGSSPSAGVVKAARAIAVVVCLASAFGMLEHVHGNYESGPLDATYGDQWDTMGLAQRWWLALIKSVGPSPALAPGVLALSALCVLGATLRHPALRDAG